jgi:hypothetical protein
MCVFIFTYMYICIPKVLLKGENELYYCNRNEGDCDSV